MFLSQLIWSHFLKSYNNFRFEANKHEGFFLFVFEEVCSTHPITED